VVSQFSLLLSFSFLRLDLLAFALPSTEAAAFDGGIILPRIVSEDTVVANFLRPADGSVRYLIFVV